MSALDYADALAKILEISSKLESKTEILTLNRENILRQKLLGRVLATDIYAPHSMPKANVSAMDGYALNLDSQKPESHYHYHVIGESAAGKPFTGRVGQGQAVPNFHRSADSRRRKSCYHSRKCAG